MRGHTWVAGVTLPLDSDREAEVYARFLTDRQPEHRRPLVTGVHVDVLDVFCDRCRVRWEVADDHCEPINMNTAALTKQEAQKQAELAERRRYQEARRAGRVGGPARLPRDE